ncbi:MAG: MFS transporter [Cyanobacteria bacterium P01_A01_bin.83]
MTLNTKVLWIKVWGIAAVQSSITLTWVIYNLYFPLLLVEFGFTKELAVSILIIENALESIAEPVFGQLSDRQQRLFGSKIPLISWGIILSSVLFILFPCLVIFNLEQILTKWFMPILAIVWAGAMAVFRAPAMTLLGRCANKDNLPRAASILTLVGGIVGAFRFDAYGLIVNLGADFAFCLGSFSLLISALILRRLYPEHSPLPRQSKPVKIPLLLLSLIFTTGILISWSVRFIMPAVRESLKFQFGADNGKLAMTFYLILLGIAALPAGKIAAKLNNNRTMLMGALGTIIALAILALFPNNILPILLLIICFSLVLNGIIPLILTLVAKEKSGFGVGLYFGGFGAGMSSFDFIFTRFEIVNYQINIVYAISFLGLLCLWLTFTKKYSRPR